MLARAVPSGGLGISQFPSVEVRRATSKNAPRHPGSRHAFDIIAPFHWFQSPVWHPSQLPASFSLFHTASNGTPVCGAPNAPPADVVSETTYGAGSGIRLVKIFSSPCLANAVDTRPATLRSVASPSTTPFHLRFPFFIPSSFTVVTAQSKRIGQQTRYF